MRPQDASRISVRWQHCTIDGSAWRKKRQRAKPVTPPLSGEQTLPPRVSVWQIQNWEIVTTLEPFSTRITVPTHLVQPECYKKNRGKQATSARLQKLCRLLCREPYILLHLSKCMWTAIEFWTCLHFRPVIFLLLVNAISLCKERNTNFSKTSSRRHLVIDESRTKPQAMRRFASWYTRVRRNEKKITQTWWGLCIKQPLDNWRLASIQTNQRILVGFLYLFMCRTSSNAHDIFLIFL